MRGLLSLPTPPPIKAEGRVHRIKDDEEPDNEPHDPRPASFVAVDATGDLRITKLRKREPPMPKGVYERKPRNTDAANDAGATEPKRRGRKAKKSGTPATARRGKAAGPRFGVFDDGSVQVSLAKCSGRMSAEDAAALVEFIGRLRAA